MCARRIESNLRQARIRLGYWQGEAAAAVEENEDEEINLCLSMIEMERENVRRLESLLAG